VYVDGKPFLATTPRELPKTSMPCGFESAGFRRKVGTIETYRVDDVLKEKAMNLELKEELRKVRSGKSPLPEVQTKKEWALCRTWQLQSL